jgi:hypothetical protein
MRGSDRPQRAEALCQVIAQLAEVQDALLALPPDDLAARHELHRRQDGLRAEAAAIARGLPVSAEARRHLEARLARLRHRLAERTGRTLTGALAGGGVGPGLRPSGMAVDTMLPIDRELLAARDLDGLRQEIAVLEQRLTTAA